MESNRFLATLVGMLILAVVVVGFAWFVLRDTMLVNFRSPQSDGPVRNNRHTYVSPVNSNQNHRSNTSKHSPAPNDAGSTSNAETIQPPIIDEPYSAWRSNPKYKDHEPQLSNPAEREDAVMRLKDITFQGINSHDSMTLVQLFLEWQDPQNRLAPELTQTVLTDTNDPMRTFSLRNLGDMKIEENRELYKELCGDPYAPIRLNAIIALAILGGSDILPYLQDALNDPDQAVQEEARKRLAAMPEGTQSK